MKRVGYIISVILVSILLVGSMIVCVLSSDRVETAAVNLVAEEFQKGYMYKDEVLRHSMVKVVN